MKNLLQNIPYTSLVEDITMRETADAIDLLAPMVKDYTASGGYNWAVGTAYLLGVKQGVHNERRRRRQYIPEALTTNERNTLAGIISLDMIMSISLHPGMKYRELRKIAGIRKALDLAERLNLYPELEAQNYKVTRCIRPLWDFVGLDPDAIPEPPKTDDTQDAAQEVTQDAVQADVRQGA